MKFINSIKLIERKINRDNVSNSKYKIRCRDCNHLVVERDGLWFCNNPQENCDVIDVCSRLAENNIKNYLNKYKNQLENNDITLDEYCFEETMNYLNDEEFIKLLDIVNNNDENSGIEYLESVEKTINNMSDEEFLGAFSTIYCQNCPCLIEKDGEWYCDEAQKLCKDIIKCPEVIEKNIKDNKNISKGYLIIEGELDDLKEIYNHIDKKYPDVEITDNIANAYWKDFIESELECNDIQVGDEKIEELKDNLFNNDEFIEDLRLYITELISENLEE